MASLVLNGNTSGSVTISSPAVSGTTTLTLPTTSGTVLTSASSQVTGPAFSVGGSAFQSIANNTFTKITFNTEIFDTNNNYDPTTNYRFTPTVAGYYQINATIFFSSAASGVGAIYVYKNGSSYTISSSVPLNVSNSIYLPLCNIVYCNGSTDYIEIYAYQTSGGNLNVGSNGTQQQFNGCLVRSA